MWNGLISKHFSHLQESSLHPSIEVDEKLKEKVEKRLKKNYSINEYKDLFQVKERIDKLNEIINWIDDVEK